jgi:hypothetical protein
MNTSVVALAKKEGKNEVVLTLELSPANVVFYSSADWAKAFAIFSHDLIVNEAMFDTESNRLRISMTYN